MRILVTGGTGFLGKRLVQKLLLEKHEVRVFANNIDGDTPESAILFKGDIRDKVALRRAMLGADVVYHLSASLDEEDRDMIDVNVKGTQNVAELCEESKVKHLVFMSSSGVLGETEIPAREDFPYNPKTDYEKSKAEGERIVRSSSVPFTIVRASIVIGPNMVWAQILEAVKRGYPIIGSGKNHFHLVYIDDVVNFLDTIKLNKNAQNHVFHIASPDTPTYEEVYRIIAKELGVKKEIKYVPLLLAYLNSYVRTLIANIKGTKPPLIARRSSIDRLVRNRIMSAAKARERLGFEAKYDTRSAIRETIKYLRIARLGYSDYDITEIHRIKGDRNEKS